MCSILGLLELRDDPAGHRRLALELSRRMRHRGPDWRGVWSGGRALLVHERLAIVDVEHGAQPLIGRGGAVALAVNGELYNHTELEAALAAPYPFTTRSDCEVILALYAQRGDDPGSWRCEINGIFAFVLYDADEERYLIARDPVGVMPLYLGRDADGTLYVASEMKALVDRCPSIEDFPPGHLLDSRVGEPVPYAAPRWRDYRADAGAPAAPAAVRGALEAAVERQLMCDVPYGALLSGGLDSSIVAALAKRFCRRRVETGGRTEAWWPQLHTFAIGLEGSPQARLLDCRLPPHH
jgi:asparagine synthase (glutamine-hydrolysing)